MVGRDRAKPSRQLGVSRHIRETTADLTQSDQNRDPVGTGTAVSDQDRVRIVPMSCGSGVSRDAVGGDGARFTMAD